MARSPPTTRATRGNHSTSSSTRSTKARRGPGAGDAASTRRPSSAAERVARREWPGAAAGVTVARLQLRDEGTAACVAEAHIRLDLAGETGDCLEKTQLP